MSYPETFDDLPEDQTNATVQRDNHPGLHNDLAAAINAIQKTLGRSPEAAFADVAARLDAIGAGTGSTPLTYRGTWDPSTNTPTLADGDGTTAAAGKSYIASADGSIDLGSGSLDFGVGDFVIYSGTVWEKIGGPIVSTGGDETVTGNWTFSRDAGDVNADELVAMRGSTLRKTVFDVTRYGAQGDGKLHIATMAASSTALTLALGEPGATSGFTAADVGKLILVRGAGAAGADLISTIATFIDIDHVTLDDAAGTSVSNKYAVSGTDDTDAIQDAVDAACDVGGGIIYFPAAPYTATGRYIVAGTLRTAPTFNPAGGTPVYRAQIVLPASSGTTGKIWLRFQGDRPSHWQDGADGFSTPLGRRSEIISIHAPATYSSGIPCLIGGPDPSDGSGPRDVAVEFQDIKLIAGRDGFCALNLYKIAQARLDGFRASTLELLTAWAHEPVIPTSIGVLVPGFAAFDNNRIGTVGIEGFYCGLVWGELMTSESLILYHNKIAVSPPPEQGYGPMFHYLQTSACAYGIAYNDFTGAGLDDIQALTSPVLTVERMTIETAGSNWYAHQDDLYDPTNVLRGYINHDLGNAGGGGWSQSGGTGVTVTDLRA